MEDYIHEVPKPYPNIVIEMLPVVGEMYELMLDIFVKFTEMLEKLPVVLEPRIDTSMLYFIPKMELADFAWTDESDVHNEVSELENENRIQGL